MRFKFSKKKKKKACNWNLATYLGNLDSGPLESHHHFASVADSGNLWRPTLVDF